MTLPAPPISIDGEKVTRGKVTLQPGDNVKVTKGKGVYTGLFTDRKGGTYMQVIIDGRSHYLPCSEVTSK